MSKEVSNEEINDKELESPVKDEIGESQADEVPGQAQEIEDEETTADKPKEELPPPTPEELKQLRADAAKAGEYYERLLRQVAETDNLRKRLAKEKQDAIRYANESLIEQLLPTMDSFDMAMMAVNSADETSIDSLKTGIEMVHTQLKRTLEEVGLTEIDATGQDFDPTLHEAMSRKETYEAEEGVILEQIRKGYKLKDRLVRPASVVVATAPGENNEPEKGEDEQWPRPITTNCSASRKALRRMRSKRPTANWPSSIIPTKIPTTRPPRKNSRRSARPTKC